MVLQLQVLGLTRFMLRKVLPTASNEVNIRGDVGFDTIHVTVLLTSDRFERERLVLVLFRILKIGSSSLRDIK
jgi:hypothetical protein